MIMPFGNADKKIKMQRIALNKLDKVKINASGWRWNCATKK